MNCTRVKEYFDQFRSDLKIAHRVNGFIILYIRSVSSLCLDSVFSLYLSQYFEIVVLYIENLNHTGTIALQTCPSMKKGMDI